MHEMGVQSLACQTAQYRFNLWKRRKEVTEPDEMPVSRHARIGRQCIV